jgi:hypothetical protein
LRFRPKINPARLVIAGEAKQSNGLWIAAALRASQ